MREFWTSCAVFFLVGACAVAQADTVPLSQQQPVALARGGAGTICHCPCKGRSCDCTMHGETCHRCYDLTVGVAPIQLAPILGAGEPPVLEASHAAWFETAPHPELKVGLEATMRDTGEKETFTVRFVPDTANASLYVPDKEFDPAAYTSWVRRVDAQAGASLSVGAKDDPGTWRIADGNLGHLNESLAKSFRLVRPDRSRLEVFRSESTLGWEANLYLRAVVAGIEEDALEGRETDPRGRLLSLVDLVDLQMKAGDAAGTVRSLDTLLESARTGLDAGHESTAGVLCGFRKIRNLLVPGSRCS
jgi:hypothetical protein